MKLICCQKEKNEINNVNRPVEDDDDGHDVISKYTGHVGLWGLVWVGTISLLQINFGMQAFAFPFQVRE